MITGSNASSYGEVGMLTSTVRAKERAIPQTSNPGPTFAVVAGTWIL